MGHQKLTTGLFVSFEGIDGVGKTTQITRLREALIENGWSVTVVREPGGTPIGEAIRSWLLFRDIESITTKMLLFAVARAELISQVVYPALNRGDIVLADRFRDSSVAYQVYGEGLERKWVDAVNDIATMRLQPDVTFWLHGRPHTLPDTQDAFEKNNEDFYLRVAEGYAALFQEAPERWVLVDANLPVNDVFHTLLNGIQQAIEEKGRVKP